MSLHHQKSQGRDYVVSENSDVGGSVALIGMKYVSESLRGKVISSSWAEFVDTDGTCYRLNTRVRVGLTPSGKEFEKIDRTLILRSVSAELKAEVAATGSNLLNTSLGTVCVSCLTSDHIRESKNSAGNTCTRCGSWLRKDI
jgi:hypothetical protein